MRNAIILIVVALLALVGIGWLIVNRNAASPSDTPISEELATADKVFAEVSTQFGFARSDVLYFVVYGEDRAQYNSGSGLTFAYKDNGSWHISGPVGAQEVPLCELLNDVPERYRQACYEPSTGENRYIENGDNANYPSASGVRYIQSI